MTEIKPGSDSMSVGATSEIVKTHVASTGMGASFDVFPDGQHFVMATIRKGTLHDPLTLLTNWPSLLSAK